MMATNKNDFSNVSGYDDIYSLRCKNLRCFAIKLQDNSICVVSPCKNIKPQSIEHLKSLGDVRYIVAPNHYHNAGLISFAQYFPKAKICAPSAALERLVKITGLKMADMKEVSELLPKGVTLLQPKGLKTGEVWLRVLQSKKCSWIVVDSFCGPAKGSDDDVNAPELLKTFARYGIADKPGYQKWVLSQIKKDKPSMLLPCHGAFVTANKLPQLLQQLVENL